MTIELTPLGVKCNLRCPYCYENPQRDAGNVPQSYDMKRMKEAIDKEGGPFSLFGGEPLMIPLKDLEEIWSWGYQKWRRNSIQSNGTLINASHIKLFKRYQVHVGISIDGPGSLNDLRIVGNLEKTREATKKTELAIERLCDEGIPTSLIVTLHRVNASGEKLYVLHKWMRYLARRGIQFVRLHLLESENDTIRSMYSLTNEENYRALASFIKLERETEIKFDIFKDMHKMLLGKDKRVTCIWRGCDPYTTRAVRGVNGKGQRTNCGRTNKDGIEYVKADVEGFERYISLYNTPQEYGGCKGCRFFIVCKGNCPGTSIDADWRNKSEHCETWKSLYSDIERKLSREGAMPITIKPHLRNHIENRLLQGWYRGENLSIEDIVNNTRHDNPLSSN